MDSPNPTVVVDNNNVVVSNNKKRKGRPKKTTTTTTNNENSTTTTTTTTVQVPVDIVVEKTKKKTKESDDVIVIPTIKKLYKIKNQSDLVAVPTIQTSFTIRKPTGAVACAMKNKIAVAKKTKSPMQLIAETFERASMNKDLQGIWMSDITMIELLSDKYQLRSLLPKKDPINSRKALNIALSRSPKYEAIDQSIPWNATGCYRISHTVGGVGSKRLRSFFYFSGSESIGPSILTRQEAKLIYAESEKQLQLDLENEPGVVDVAEEEECVQPATTNEATIETNETAAAKKSAILLATLNFWNSANAKRLFGSDLDDDDNDNEQQEQPKDYKELLRRKITICQQKADACRGSKIRDNYLTLRLAYNVALHNMPDVTWSECCERSLEHMKIAGIATIEDPKSIVKWHRFFRTHLYLENDPNHIVPKEPTELPLFAAYPRTKELANLYMATTTETVSIQSFREHMINVIIPTIVHEENTKLEEQQGEEEEEQPKKWTFDSLLASIGLKQFSKGASFRHLTKLGYKYCYDKKRFAINCTRPKAKYKCKPVPKKNIVVVETTTENENENTNENENENEHDSETSYY